MRKRTSCPARDPEARADTAAQALTRVLTAAMASWAATLRLSVTCVAVVLATAAGTTITDRPALTGETDNAPLPAWAIRSSQKVSCPGQFAH